MIYKLKNPVTVGKESKELLSALVFREPRAKDMRHMPAAPGTDDMLKLASTLCGQSDAVIDLLSVRDMAGVLKVVSDFFDDGQATGPTTSP